MQLLRFHECFYNFLHSVTQFYNCIVTASAESVGGSTPGVRVTWETTVPTGGIKSVRVEFRLTSSHGTVVATYTTTNTSQTEIIQTGLQCATKYYIRVVVTGEIWLTNGSSVTAMLSGASDVQFFLEGKEIVCMHKISITVANLMVVMPHHSNTRPSWSES